MNPFRILVIRLGALGDFVQSFPAFSAIRHEHPAAEITLLTTTPFVALAKASPWFDKIETNVRPGRADLAGFCKLRRQLRGFDMIYDLQTSSRSSRYFRFAGQKNWSGIAPGCRFPHANPFRNEMHTRSRQRDQLRMAGFADVPDAETGWLEGPLPKDIPADRPLAVLVPGAAPHRPAKRWPVTSFGEIARILVKKGFQPIVAGGNGDRPLGAEIKRLCPETIDLTGHTDLLELAALLGHSQLAIGNDTGPMHLAAMLGSRSVVLFSAESDPTLTAPLGRQAGQVSVLRVKDLATLSPSRVAEALS